MPKLLKGDHVLSAPESMSDFDEPDWFDDRTLCAFLDSHPEDETDTAMLRMLDRWGDLKSPCKLLPRK